MGTVAVTYNLMPEDTSFDADGLKARIGTIVPKGVQVARAEVKPFAFGLRILEIVCVMDDKAGGVEQLEEQLRAIEGIQNVETTGVTLV
jgi:translation elongation factor aEF-1 beta